MSYILDALRKADAQRERDPARGIHAQSVTALPSSRDPDRASRLGWLGAGATGAALLALALWWLSRPDAPVDAPAVSPAATSAPAVALAPPPPVSSSGAGTPAPAAEVLPAAPPMRAAPVAPPVSSVAPASPGSTAPAVPPSADTARSAAAQPAPASVAAPGGERLLSIAELPADVQRDLPKLTITGGVYSADPANRMLIVNGQVLNEGAEAAPGVVLTQIRLKTAVLTFRGWRYGVNY